MEFIAAIPVIGGLLSSILPFLVVLGIVVFIHEYGHYIVGRWCGIHAEVFSIGFGKPIKQWTDKRGTVWQVALVPLGGYVKFLGDTNAASFSEGDVGDGDPRSFPNASIPRRSLTVLAGPVFNFILSVIVFAGLMMWQGLPTEVPTVKDFRVPLAERHTVLPGDQILEVNGTAISDGRDLYSAVSEMPEPADIMMRVQRGDDQLDVVAPYLFPPLAAGVQLFTAAHKAGVEAGDLILAVNGRDVVSFDELKEIVLASEGVELTVSILRDGQTLDLAMTPEITENYTPDGEVDKKVMIGVFASSALELQTVTPTPWNAVWQGVVSVGDVIYLTVNGVKHMIQGALSFNSLQGPVGMAHVSGEIASQGLVEFIQLVALISTAIGFLNLLPIPILDGGHLVIFGYEAIKGRQPDPKILNLAMSAGFVLLMSLMVFVTYNDIMRIFDFLDFGV